MSRFPFTGLTACGALGATLLIAGACSSASDEHAPTLGDGGAEAGGAGGAHAGSGAGARAGAAGSQNEDAGQGGTGGQAGGDGGAGGLEPGMVVDVPPPLCSEAADWSSPAPLNGVSSNADERLLTISADELDVVFVRGSQVLRAHRASASAGFAKAAAVTIPDGYGVTDGAALSADGKTLILIATSGQAFAALTRTSRTADFGTSADTSAFFGVNARAVQTLEHYTAPVLAPDGNSLIFTAFTPEPEQGFPEGVEGTSVVYESHWAKDTWTMPTHISEYLFDGTTAARPLPTGLSSDSRTLFYFDEKTSKQVARFRDRPDAPLNVLIDLGDRAGAVPNAKCDVLYYSSDGDVLSAAK